MTILKLKSTLINDKILLSLLNQFSEVCISSKPDKSQVFKTLWHILPCEVQPVLHFCTLLAERDIRYCLRVFTSYSHSVVKMKSKIPCYKKRHYRHKQASRSDCRKVFSPGSSIRKKTKKVITFEPFLSILVRWSESSFFRGLPCLVLQLSSRKHKMRKS